MHALVKDGSVVKYPYTIGMLRKDNPNTSFPKRPSDELLAEWGLQVVVKTDRPEVDYTQNVDEGTPELIGGSWTQVWITWPASPEEIALRIEEKSRSVRFERDHLLRQTDWMALSDTSPMSAAWASYRQALRDITDQAGFPYDVTWPEKPSS